MKLSLSSRSDVDSLMKIEIKVLAAVRRVRRRHRRYFPRFYEAGMARGYRYAVMEMLGPSLSDLQERLEGERMTLPTTLRVGIQLVTVSSKVQKSE